MVDGLVDGMVGSSKTINKPMGQRSIGLIGRGLTRITNDLMIHCGFSGNNWNLRQLYVDQISHLLRTFVRSRHYK